ncbi:restriction endonuclease subunit S [Collinsella tanakaei]|uniref:restriction endonuclease subunit S n=1 Tax=Collinsella tanakaei TaxID=626935 RepID=UPI00265CD935|nr:restriction endonuclease subunit S [Collinsella tanakaei]
MSFKWSTLGELSIGGGKYGISAPAVEFDRNLPAYLRITDINDDGSLNLSGRKSVADPLAFDYMLQEGDIVFARTGSSTGRNYYYDLRDGDFAFAGFLIKFSLDKEKVNPRFIKYYVQSKPYWDWVSSFNTGSTRGNINAKTYAQMPVPLPDRDVQDAIVCLCDSLSNKIRINNRLNDYLAEMGTALFNNVAPQSNAPNAALSDIAEITMGQSPSGSSYNEEGSGEVFYQGRAEFGSFFPRRRLFTTEPKRMAQEGDTLMSVRAPVGDLNIANEKCCIGRGLAAIHSDTFQSFTHYLLRGQSRQLDAFNGDGTVFGSINGKALRALPIYLPTEKEINEIETELKSLDAMIRNNDDEIRLLEQLRDTLLPKLMAGEIDVSAINFLQS